jgi:hypothetical protein
MRRMIFIDFWQIDVGDRSEGVIYIKIVARFAYLF